MHILIVVLVLKISIRYKMLVKINSKIKGLLRHHHLIILIILTLQIRLRILQLPRGYLLHPLPYRPIPLVFDLLLCLNVLAVESKQRPLFDLGGLALFLEFLDPVIFFENFPLLVEDYALVRLVSLGGGVWVFIVVDQNFILLTVGLSPAIH